MENLERTILVVFGVIMGLIAFSVLKTFTDDVIEQPNSNLIVSCYYFEAVDSLRSGNVVSAVSLLEMGLRDDPVTGEHLISFAVTSDSVSQLFRDVLAVAVNNRTIEIMQSGQLPAAEAMFLNAINLNLRNCLFHYNLARIYFMQGKWGKYLEARKVLETIADSLDINCH